MLSRVSRRELLATFLGGLVVGCQRSATLPPGELVGASVDLGHRLRGNPPTATAWEEVPVVIVGAGVAGLSAARRLLRSGFDRFRILELEPAPGGTSRYGTAGIVPHPWGAHYLPAPLSTNTELITLLKEMSIVEGTDETGEPIFAEEMLCRDPHERLFAYGEWHDGLYLQAGATQEDLEQYRRFFGEIDQWIAWRDERGRRAFTLPASTGSDDAEVTALDRLSMAEWMSQRGYRSRRLLWLVDYACRDDYGTRPEDTSAWAGLFYFASRRKAPGAEPQPLLTWPEGNGRLIRHLTSLVIKQLQLNWAVADLNPVAPRRIEITAISERPWRILGVRAEQVIFAAPQFLTRYVLRPYRNESPAHLADFDYGSWMVANLHLSSRPREQGSHLAWDNVLFDSPSLGYVVATHQAGLDYGPTIFTYYYPLTVNTSGEARQHLLALSREEWAEIALADLERAHPELRTLVTRLDVMRWGHAMIRPTPGFLWGPARRQASQPYRDIYFAHSDLSGLPLFEEAFDQGNRAAEAVLKTRSSGR